MKEIDMADRVIWWLMAHHFEDDITKALLTYGEPSPLTRMHALAQDVIAAHDKNKLHCRIWAGAVADRLEGK